MTQEEAPSSRFSDYNEALLADLLANSTEILSLYSPDLLLTHSSLGLSASLGREVLPGTPLGEVYSQLADLTVGHDIASVLAGGPSKRVSWCGSNGGPVHSALLFRAAGGLGVA